MTNVHMLILASAADAGVTRVLNTPDGCVHGSVPCCVSCAFFIVDAIDRARLVTIDGVERGPQLKGFGDRSHQETINYRVNEWQRLCDQLDAATAHTEMLERELNGMATQVAALEANLTEARRQAVELWERNGFYPTPPEWVERYRKELADG